MEINLLIRNKNSNHIYKLDENCILTDNYNETLDSVNCRISHITPIDIEVGDCVYVFTTDLSISKHYMVESYVLTQDTIGVDNNTYSYDITLCSQTKDLEGYICPNLSITPLRVGTKRSIYFYLNLYNDLYGKKHRVLSSNQLNWVNSWSFSANVYNKFSQIDCPEMQWNAPTLREVFNDLMMIADCIPILRNGVIDYIDLTQKKELITDFNYIQRSQSLDDYASELRMNMQNVLQTGVENIRNTITTTEYLTFRTSDYLITSENIELRTTYPILKIKHLWMGLFVPYGELDQNGQTTNGAIVLKDLMDLDGGSYIKEYQEYTTLNVAYRLTDITSEWYNWQNYCIYYNRGSNVITGFSNVTKKFIFSTRNTIELLKDRIVLNLTPDDTELYALLINDGVSTTQNSYFTTFFKVEYETMAEQLFQASKNGAKNKRIVIDNQTNSWVDAYTQGNLEYQKANRLSNQTLLFNQRVSNISDAIKIGDYYTETKNGKTYDIIIYQTQYQIHRDHIEVNAYGTKDYVMRNYWTGINSKIRTWVNARDEALIRHELEKYYCGLSFVRHNEVEGVANGYDLAKMISESFVANDNKSIKFAMLDTKLQDNDYTPNVSLYGLTWEFKNAISFDNIATNTTFFLSITCDGVDYVALNIQVVDNGSAVKKIYYIDSNANYINVYDNGWLNSTYKTILTGVGTDSNNEYFCNWLRANANMVSENNYTYQTEMISRIMGDSYVFTTGFNDNYEAGKSVKTRGDLGITINDLAGLSYIRSSAYEQPKIVDGTITTTDNLSGIPIQPLKYTNDNGEFVTANITAFCDVLDTTSGTRMMNTSQQKELLMIMFNRPLLYNGYDDSVSHALNKKFKISKDYYKDNKEIFKLSVQFEMFSDDQDIEFTKYLLQNNAIIQDTPTAPNIKIYGSSTMQTSLPTDAVELLATLSSTSISNVVTEFTLETRANLNVFNFIYITDGNDNVMVRLKTTNHYEIISENYTIKFYLNILKDRDYSYYNNLGYKQGEI